jgi:hypothetical protein
VGLHPVLTELLNRIIRQETRHVAFYASQARQRLDASARARRVTRFALRGFWSPVGAGVMPEAETTHLLRFLFGDRDGRDAAARIDSHVDRLPGLGGLRLIDRAMSRVRPIAGTR